MHDVRLWVWVVMIYGLWELLFDTLFHLHNTFTIICFFSYTRTFSRDEILCVYSWFMAVGEQSSEILFFVVSNFVHLKAEYVFSYFLYTHRCIHTHTHILGMYIFFCRRRNWNVRETFFHWRKWRRKNPAS